MVRIEFDKKMFTNNDLKRWANSPRGKGWAIYAAWKKQLTELMKSGVTDGAIVMGLGRPRVKKLVNVLYVTKKLQDKDNLYASMKPLMDALVDLELIKDDSPQWCQLVVRQRSDYERAYKVIIEIA